MNGRKIFGLIIILIGLSVLFHLEIFNFIFAFIILWIGVRIVAGGSWNFEDYKSVVTDEFLDKVFIFSPVNKVIESDNFSGGKTILIFSGGEIDFSGAKTNKKEINMEITNVFAGLKIIIPKEWKVNLVDTSVLGGVNNKANTTGKTILNLKGSSVFGGMEIVNS